MIRAAALALALYAASLAPLSAEQLLLDRLKADLTPLGRLEKLHVIKVAENKIIEQLRGVANQREIKTEGPLWLLKVASHSYAVLTALTEQQFPTISSVYRERTEILTAVIRGKSPLSQLIDYQEKSEALKRTALDNELQELMRTDPRVLTSNWPTRQVAVARAERARAVPSASIALLGRDNPTHVFRLRHAPPISLSNDLRC